MQILCKSVSVSQLLMIFYDSCKILNSDIIHFCKDIHCSTPALRQCTWLYRHIRQLMSSDVNKTLLSRPRPRLYPDHWTGYPIMVTKWTKQYTHDTHSCVWNKDSRPNVNNSERTVLNNTKTQSRPKLFFLVPAISQSHKSLENSQDFFCQDQDHFLSSRRLETKTLVSRTTSLLMSMAGS